MSFDFFDIKDEEPEKKSTPKKEEPAKEFCPYCGKEYVNLKAHKKRCPENPKNIQKSVSTPKPVDPTKSEQELIRELRVQFEKTLSPAQKEDFSLSKEEQEKIENVIRFLGGTEGYQFIYKSITGDKIRGSMPHIIDECIEWLKKHKLYILMHK